MKKVLMGLAGLLAVTVIVVLGIAATKPATFRVERTATIAAPPSAVFANLEDFHRWPAWSPWEKLDPQMDRTYSGAPHGKGAIYTWHGNKEVGQGRMTISETRDNELVQIRLEFLEPFPADNVTTFTLGAVANGTDVHWIMEGPNSFMGKVISVFADMDHLIGGDFERGLADLKGASEGKAAAGTTPGQ
jgi:uncharacterized protein YndB with AHSA1/START domain